MTSVTSIVCTSCGLRAAKERDLDVRPLVGHHLMAPEDRREVLVPVRVCQECLDAAEDDLDEWRKWFRRLLREGHDRTAANRIMVKAMRRSP